MHRKVHEVQMRVIWPEQRQHSDAVPRKARRARRGAAVEREVHEVRKRVLGPEHQGTLLNANNLARLHGITRQICPCNVRCHEVQKRVLGAEHPETLTGANNPAISRFHQGSNAEAMDLYQAVRGRTDRVALQCRLRRSQGRKRRRAAACR